MTVVNSAAAAKANIDGIAAHVEGEAGGMGHRFIDALRETLASLSRFPALGQPTLHDLRDSAVKPLVRA